MDGTGYTLVHAGTMGDTLSNTSRTGSLKENETCMSIRHQEQEEKPTNDIGETFAATLDKEIKSVDALVAADVRTDLATF